MGVTASACAGLYNLRIGLDADNLGRSKANRVRMTRGTRDIDFNSCPGSELGLRKRGKMSVIVCNGG